MNWNIDGVEKTRNQNLLLFYKRLGFFSGECKSSLDFKTGGLKMIGYKATDKNGCCRGFKFEVGKTYTKNTPKEELQCCTDKGFHYCRELFAIEKESNYKLSESRIFEVIAGDYVKNGDKYCTNCLTILREIKGVEKNNLINSGDRNSGDCNSGNRNSGNCNSGDWNSGNCNSGYFNTNEAPVRIFNYETDKKRDNLIFPTFLYFDLTIWVSHDTATKEEKEKYKKEIEVTGGFLKTLEYKEAFRRAWDKASKDEHKQLLALPNWNNDIFKEISGIDAEAEIKKEESL